MRSGTILVLSLLIASCGSSRSKDDEPSTVPPPQPISQNSPSVETRLAELQTSMTELLERLDVLDARIAKLENVAAGVPPAGPARTLAPTLRQADIAETYRRALMLFAQNRHADARTHFQQVFDADPNGQLADNALFWIGETYFAAGDYSNAMRFYARVTKEYADQNKAPDAMFKIGLAYEKTGDLGMARRTFEECIRRYPYSTPAASAKLELKRIKY
jgi:tol-pal system protein YbgF